jgi:hypothetical protein
LSQTDADRYDRAPGQPGLITFSAPDSVDFIDMVLFFPQGGSESVVIQQGVDAQLDTRTVLVVASRAQPGACAQPTVSIDTTLVVCLLADTSYYQVSWGVPVKSTCEKAVTVRLAGARTCDVKIGYATFIT